MGIGWVLLGVLQGSYPFHQNNLGCTAACLTDVRSSASELAFSCRPIDSRSGRDIPKRLQDEKARQWPWFQDPAIAPHSSTGKD